MDFEMPMQALSVLTAVIYACIEAHFLIIVSERRKDGPLLYAVYVLALFAAEAAARHICLLLPLPVAFYRPLALLCAFSARFLFAAVPLGIPASAATGAGMVLAALGILSDALFGLMLSQTTRLLFRLAPGSPLPGLALAILACFAAQLLFCAATLRLIYRSYWPRERAYASRYVSVLLFPAALLIFALERSLGAAVVEVRPWHVVTLTNASNSVPWEMLFAFVLSFAVFQAVLAAYGKLNEALRREGESAALRDRVNAQKKYVREAERRYTAYRVFKHDIGNHFLALKGLVARNERDKALEYLGRIHDGVQEWTFLVNSGNPVVDILLTEKLAYAKSCGIAATCAVALPSAGNVEDFDLCIVLANLLDNAVSACLKEGIRNPFVDVKLVQKKQFLVLEVRNGYGDFGEIREGLGLRNARLTAEKYGGTLHLEIAGGAVSATALLCIPAGTES